MHPRASFPSLVPFGWSEREATLFLSDPSSEDPAAVPGRATRVDRDRYHVVTPHGLAKAPADPLPAVGDWVVLREQGDGERRELTTAAVLPRRTEIARADPHAGRQVLAANVDVVLVCHPLDRPPSANRLERELVVAWDGGALPVVVLTKADALPDAEAVAAALAERVVGVDVLVTSAATGLGVDAIAALARPSRTLALIGPSGAGKSTLANRLLGEETLETGEVREGDHRGRHTTTARFLLPIPGGGVLLDTPGLRSLGLTVNDDGLAATFPDVEELAAGCRFADCAHGTEPGCAVLAAVASGALGAERLASWQKLSAEVERARREADALARAAHKAGIKRAHRAMRRRG